MSNINSFAENVNRLVRSANNQIALLNGIQESVVTENASVSISTEDENGKQVIQNIPSWNALSEKVDAVANSVNSLLKGKGVVKVGDGTARTVEMTNIANVPSKITNLKSPTTFNIDANWWFEDMMYPAAQVSIDLVGKIDEQSDRVLVNRVILDNSNDRVSNFYHSSGIENSNVSYEELIELLSNNEIGYTEDKEVLSLPLSTVSYIGTFKILDVEFLNGSQWYTVDTNQYKIVKDSDSNHFTSQTATLKVGDKLSFDNYLYEIIEMSPDNLAFRVRCTIGYDFPKTGEYFDIYNEPWQNKMVNIKFSNDEINIVYFKGVNENFNIVANEWSEPIMFVSNDLVFEDDFNTSFNKFYSENIVDWGKSFINDIKERRICAMDGLEPNVPTLNASDFKVVQINTQVNASLDTAEVLKMKADIETTKSRLTSLDSTIASQQSVKQTITDAAEYNKITKQINKNIESKKQLQTNYRTSLDSIMSLLRENNAVKINPKYHVRGFFGIPAPIYKNNIPQQIIGFEIQYRYIKEDETGVDLKTFSYIDLSGDEHTGVFTDWNIIQGPTLEKVFDENVGYFVWVNKNISDGEVININQIDIPITKGEKLEFRVRSVSEAGYPYTPLKSKWSESVIIDFPSNLLTSTDIDNLITDINEENIINTINSQLETQGYSVHIDDSEANPNSVNNTYFKHQARNISYEFKDPDTNEIRTISVQDALDSIFAFIKSFVDYTDGKSKSTDIYKIDIKESDKLKLPLRTDAVAEYGSSFVSLKEGVMRIPADLIKYRGLAKDASCEIEFTADNETVVENKDVAEGFNSYDFDVVIIDKAGEEVSDKVISGTVLKEMTGENVRNYSGTMLLDINKN